MLSHHRVQVDAFEQPLHDLFPSWNGQRRWEGGGAIKRGGARVYRFLTFPQILATVGRFVGGVWQRTRQRRICRGARSFLVDEFDGSSATRLIFHHPWTLASAIADMHRRSWHEGGAKNWNYSSIFPRNALITPRRFLEVSVEHRYSCNFKLFFAAEKEDNLSRVFLSSNPELINDKMLLHRKKKNIIQL